MFDELLPDSNVQQPESPSPANVRSETPVEVIELSKDCPAAPQ